MFKVRKNSVENVLNVADDFATLISYHDGILTFEISYSFVDDLIVKLNSTLVKITFRTRDVSLKNEIEKNKSIDTDSDESINDNLSFVSRMKDKTKSKDKYVVSRKKSNPNSMISDEYRQNQKLGVKTFKKIVKMTSSDTLKQSNQNILIPGGILSDVDQQVSESKNDKEVLVEAMTIFKKDVSSVLIEKDNSSSPSSYFDKFREDESKNSQRNNTQFSDLQVRLTKGGTSNRNETTSDSSRDSTVAYVVETVEKTHSKATATVKIDEQRLNVDGFFKGNLITTFELIDSRGNVLEVVKKSLDVTSQLILFNTPTIPPSMTATPTGINSEKMSLNIVQKDGKASSVKLFRRQVSNSPGLYGSYAYVSTHNLKKNQRMKIDVPRPNSGFYLYRIIPISSDGVMSHNYTNVVVYPKSQSSKVENPIIITTAETSGVKVVVKNIPSGVVALRINRRDKTLHEKKYETVSQTISTRKNGQVVFIDDSIESYHQYEYNCSLVYRAGDVIERGYSIIEFVKNDGSSFVDIKMSNFRMNDALNTNSQNFEKSARVLNDQLSQSNMNVTFNIISSLTNNEADDLKTMLDERGLSEMYSSEIKNDRDLLKDIISYNVKRINLTTGQTDDFGTITGESFDESVARKNKQIDPIKAGNSYKYVITPMVSNPEVLFENFEKSIVDDRLKRTYKVKPSKFFHFTSLKRGTISSKETRSKFHAKTSQAFNMLNTSFEKDIDLTKSTFKVKSIFAKKMNSKTVIVQWSLIKNSDTIDAFLVMKEINGIRTLIGKVHGEYSTVSKFYHRFTEDDYGLVKYIVIPIMNDFSIGQEIESNSVILG